MTHPGRCWSVDSAKLGMSSLRWCIRDAFVEKVVFVRFWIHFGYILDTHFHADLYCLGLQTHFQKSPGLMTLLNVATAVLGHVLNNTRDHIPPLCHRQPGYERPRYDFVAGLSQGETKVKTVVKRWNHCDLKRNGESTLLNELGTEGLFKCFFVASVLKSSWGIHALGKIGQFALLRKLLWRCNHKCFRFPFSLSKPLSCLQFPCARHLWTSKIPKAVALILALYKMSADWVTWHFQHFPKCLSCSMVGDKRSLCHGATMIIVLTLLSLSADVDGFVFIFGTVEAVGRFRGLEHPGISAVAEAYIQGLAQNLAFFVSKCGVQVGLEMHSGRRISGFRFFFKGRS